MGNYVFAFTDKGCVLAQKLVTQYPWLQAMSLPKFASNYGFIALENLGKTVEKIFDNAQLLIFIGACGIGVRAIAPCVKSKTTDPAVLCIDEKGQYVIPILSGHMGGANKWAKEIGQFLNALPIITTATDVNQRFSVDEWAVNNRLTISDMKKAKAFAATVLTQDIQLKTPFPICGKLPSGLTLEPADTQMEIHYRQSDNLVLIPKVLYVGIGCRKNIAYEKVWSFLDQVFQENNLDVRSIKGICSIDLKKEEQALCRLSNFLNVPFTTFTAQELEMAAQNCTQSAFVKGVTGVGSVCEASCTTIENTTLIIEKTAKDGVTIAVSLITDWEINF